MTGGGIDVLLTLALTNTQFVSNTAGGAGGGAWVQGAATLNGGLFQQNASTANDGGGLYVKAALTLTGTQFISNTASGGGGASVLGAATLNGGLFRNNTGRDPISGFANGGGLLVTGTLTLTGTQFVGNVADYNGGGAYVSGTVSLNGGLFQNNSSDGAYGGGLYANASLVLSGTQFIGNAAPEGDGGGAYVEASTTLNSGLFQNNFAYDGGGLYLDTGSLTLTNTQFLSNTAVEEGGGADVNGTAILIGGLFQNNVVQGPSYGGGGLIVYANLALTGTLFIGNRAADGSALMHYAGAGRFVNALFAHNIVTGTGGVLSLRSNGTVQILHTTIASPTLNSRPALNVRNSSVGITDTIIVSHSIAITNSGGAVYEDYNDFFGNPSVHSGGFATGGHDIAANPLFINAGADNYHLLPVSPAIDAGVSVGITRDIDGDPRPQGNAPDIGYDETSVQRLYLPLIQR